ncbi:MAG: hypothetical protein CL610_08125 [Anaerolineaceae bacterium]|nr:hypothetical protein [Anaerolineaceae bacterium]
MTEVGLAKEQLDTPVLWVDLNILERNIALLVEHFRRAGVNWRPHVKGVKVPELAHMLVDAGAIGVTCAKLGEAEVMAAAGITDILVANQVVGPRKIERLVRLARTADIKVAVDNAENVNALSQAATEQQVEIGVLVDVDTGMNRTGVQPGPAVVELARQVHAASGLRFLGLMAWEGHTLVHKETDVKHGAIVRAVELLTKMAADCEAAGLPVTIVSGGGSGTYKVTPFLPNMTEIQAGGAIFSDVAYSGWGVETTPCLFVRSIVTSRPAPDRMVFDAGYKALPAWIAQPKPIGIDHIVKYSTSAEHGVITLSEPNLQIKVGDVFDFVVGYTDSTLFLHNQLYGIRNDVVENVWTVSARGMLT